jgi:mycoredoxin
MLDETSENSEVVVVYGTGWCAATQRVRRLLDRLKVHYAYHNLDSDPKAVSQVRWWTGGHTSHPTVQVGGDILVEPSVDEVEVALYRNGLV